MIRYQASPAIPAAPSPSCRAALVARLADDMREMAHAGQNVSAETLAERGWSAGIVRKFGPDAVNRARRLSVRQKQ